MSLLPGIADPYLEALVGGLVWGSVFCTSSCLPYIASYIAGVGAGFRRGVVVTLFFNCGRIASYALIGAAVGIFKLVIEGSYLTSFQQYGSAAFGAVSIVIGASILLKTRVKSSTCNCPAKEAVVPANNKRSWFDLGAFTLGLSRGFVLCLPLLLLLATTAAFASPVDSFAVAVLFGLGTAISPLLLVGGVTGWLLTKAPLFRVWISRVGGGILILLGAYALISSVMITQK